MLFFTIAQNYWEHEAALLIEAVLSLQGLAVLGVIGIFVLWHVRQRRRSLENVPLKDRGKSTRVVTLNMLGLGGDTSSIKSRQRMNMERSTTLG